MFAYLNVRTAPNLHRSAYVKVDARVHAKVGAKVHTKDLQPKDVAAKYLILKDIKIMTEEIKNSGDDAKAVSDSLHSPSTDAAPGASADMSSAEPSEETVADSELFVAQAKAAEYYDAFLRAKADLENVRRRAQEDVAKAYKYAVESFAESLVPVLDSFDAALANTSATPEALRSGVELTQKQLQSAFEKAKIVAIDPVGEKFDPHLHQAISMVPAPEGVAPNHVVAVLQKGYSIADRILRPALVTVAQA